MKSFLIRLGLFTLAFYGASHIFRGVYVDNLWASFLMAVAFTFLNQFIKPILTILALPVTVLTLGIFQLFVNMVVLLLADWLVDGFHIYGWLSAFVLTIVLILFNFIISFIVPKD